MTILRQQNDGVQRVSLLKQQSGFALLELIAAMALACLIALWGASAWMQQAEDATAQASGVWLLTLKKAVDQMLVRQADLLVGLVGPEQSGPAYRDIWQPTIAELIAAGHLPKGFPVRPALGYQAQIRVFAPTGACLTRGCKIEALVLALPVGDQVRHAANTNRLGQLLLALEGQGASVHPFAPLRLKGPLVDRPNPPSPELAVLPVGTIAALSFYDSTQYAHFVRREDLRDTSLKGAFAVAQGVTVGADVDAARAVRSGGRISAGEYLQVGSSAQEGESCEAEGLIARGGVKHLLLCQQGRWRGSGSNFGGIFMTHSAAPCHIDSYGINKANPQTGSCGCPEGFAGVLTAVWRYPAYEVDEFRSYVCLR